MLYTRVRGWTSGRSLPVLNFGKYPRASEKADIMITTCCILTASPIFNVFFLTILPRSPFGWQIKPACITFSRPNNITIVIIPSQSSKTRYEDFKIFFQHWKLFCMIVLTATLDEQFKSSKSWHQTEQTTEENLVKSDWFNGVSRLFYINKKQVGCQEWDSNPRLQE